MNIITAAKSVSDIVRSTLGPRAMLKMLLDSNGSAVLTADGASILREIDVRHPAAKSVIELSRTQDERVGDGTTSVVVLAGELMSAARPLVLGGQHPTKITAAYRKAAELSLAHLRSISKPIDLDDRSRLIALAATALGTKYVARFADLVPSLAVDSVQMVSGAEGRPLHADVKELVKVEKVQGGDIEESRVLRGTMINKDVLHSAMRRRIEKPKILLLDTALEYKKAESETNIEMSSAADWRRYLELEEGHVRSLCAAIRALGPDVVVCEKGVSDMAQHFLLQANISVLRRVRKSDLHRLALACGARVSSRPEKMKPSDVGTGCGLFEVRKLGDDHWAFFEDCRSPKACSVLLRGASKDSLSEVERNLADAVGVVRNLLLKPKVVPGGGACELSMAASLRKRTLRNNSPESGEFSLSAFSAAARALEVVPKTLAENAGAKVCRVLAHLRTEHDKDAASTFGVDGHSGKMVDMKELGVWEPLAVKEQVVKTAFESATVLLRIDDILSGVSKADKGPGQAPPMQQPPAMM